VEGHEAGKGDKVRAGDLIKQLASISCTAKVSITAEDFAGNGLVLWVETLGNGLGVDFLELPERFALGEKVVANASIHLPPSLSSSREGRNQYRRRQ